MFIRNGEAVGSVLNSTEPEDEPEAEEAEAELGDQRTDLEREADEQAALAREQLARQGEQLEVPARGGSHGTREAWAAFLDSKGIDYPADPEVAGRNDLIAIWDNLEGK